MRITTEVRGSVTEAYLQPHREHALGMLLRPGFMEFGPRRSALERTWFDTGEMGLCKRQTFAANVRIDPDARVTSPADSVSSGFLQAASQDRVGLPQTPPGTTRFPITFQQGRRLSVHLCPARSPGREGPGDSPSINISRERGRPLAVRLAHCAPQQPHLHTCAGTSERSPDD